VAGPGIVDTHVHVVSGDDRRYPLEPSDLTGPWYREAPCSIERLLELMDTAGVDRAVLVQGVSAYRYDNRYTADSARRFPERCTSVGCIDVSAPDAADVARQLVEHEGVRGIRWFLDPRPFADAFDVVQAVGTLGVPLVVTILPDRLGELAAALADLPPAPVALDHCGFADFGDGVPDDLAALVPYPEVHLKVSTMTLDRLAGHGDVRDAVAMLADRFGSDRLMWGSDFSQTHDRPYPELAELARHASSRLGDDERAAFLAGTACHLWPELAR
jgi:predicted TIM-barrel fold metal-dependent hydrolase